MKAQALKTTAVTMKYRKLIIIPALALAAYFAAMEGSGLPTHAHASATTAPGEDSGTPPAPDFTLPNVMNGGSVNLAGMKGKWVFINFWATWCNPCVYEMPMLNTFYHKMKKNGMEVLAISVDNTDAGAVKNFASKLKVDFTILHDRSNHVMRKYRVQNIPYTFVVGPDGNIQAVAQGMRPWDDPEMFKFFSGLMDEYSRRAKPKTAEKKKPCADC